MKLIGRGMFSRVYQSDEVGSDHVIILSNDRAKEALSFNWHDNETGIFPTLEKVDYTGDFFVYTQKFYPRIRAWKKALDADQYRLYCDLKEVFNDTCMNVKNEYDRYYMLYNAFDKSPIREDYKQDILSMIDSLANFGADIGFEISPRNIAIENGKLILLDCFFFTTDLLKARKKSRNNFKL